MKNRQPKKAMAGMTAAMITSRYGTTVMAESTKAATPITGGMIWPPEDAAASTPPAKGRLNPRRSIIGMVSTPVDSTLTTGPPEMVPNMAELTMAAWAGPPRSRRVATNASLISDRPPAEAPNRLPSTM